MSVLIVEAAAIRARQHLVGLCRFLEQPLGFRVAGVAIRVVLHRESSIGALDLASIGGAFDGKDFVVVSRDCHANDLAVAS